MPAYNVLYAEEIAELANELETLGKTIDAQKANPAIPDSWNESYRDAAKPYMDRAAQEAAMGFERLVKAGITTMDPEAPSYVASGTVIDELEKILREDRNPASFALTLRNAIRRIFRPAAELLPSRASWLKLTEAARVYGIPKVEISRAVTAHQLSHRKQRNALLVHRKQIEALRTGRAKPNTRPVNPATLKAIREARRGE